MAIENEQVVVFKPFVRFVIEFHNNTMKYASLLRKKIPYSTVLEEADIELIEEAFIIKHMAEWEIFLHNMFAYCIAVDTSQLSNHLDLTLPKKVSFDTAYAILNGLNFLSITNTEELKGLAKKILVASVNPFAQFEKPFLKRIDEAYVIRNYIAHKSKRAKKRLEKMYQNTYRLNEFTSPGSFLRQKIDSELPPPNSDQMYRSDLYYGTFMTITMKIWEHLDPESHRYVYPDTQSIEGYFKGMERMQNVFNLLTSENNL